MQQPSTKTPTHGLNSQTTLALSSVGIVINTLSLAPFLFMSSLLRLAPNPAAVALSRKTAINIAELWISRNSAILSKLRNTELVVTGLDTADLQMHKSYMLVCNHQSWADIFILQQLLNKQIPLQRFFLKQELIWVPIMGLCWWVLDFPFMKRYSKETLAKHPELKGKDKQTTLERCKRLAGNPSTIVNFLEGTRFTPAKHDKGSAFKHLLNPKSAGAAYALSVLHSIDTLLDITIVYADGAPTFTDFLAGKCRRVYIDIKTQPIPVEMHAGDYENDPVFKQQFQDWISNIWQHKDQLINQLKR